MAKVISASSYMKKNKKKGLASKNKSSNNKDGKLYRKSYRGQGR